MKRMKKYISLLLALLLCLMALWGCGEKAPEEKQPEDNDLPQNENALPVTTFSDVIECCNGDHTLRFQRNEEGNWQWKDDTDFPLDGTYVDTLAVTIDAMLSLQPVNTDKTLKSLNLEEDDTEQYVTVSDEKGQTVTWYLGKQDDNGCYYMRRDGDATNTIYLAPADLAAQIDRSIYDMMVLPKLPAIKEDTITSITIQTGETPLQFQPVGDKWFDIGQVNVTEKLRPLLTRLAAPEIAACVDFKPSKGAPAICGLDEPAAVLTVEYKNYVGADCTFVLSAGNARGTGYCVTIDDDSTIYLMDAPLVDALLAFAQ